MNGAKPAKVVLIERSLNCFVCGLFGLLPVFGVPVAIRALNQAWLVNRDSSGMWNPARRYLVWGVVCALVGLLLLALLISGVALAVYFSDVSGNQSFLGHVKLFGIL